MVHFAGSVKVLPRGHTVTLLGIGTSAAVGDCASAAVAMLAKAINKVIILFIFLS